MLKQYLTLKVLLVALVVVISAACGNPRYEAQALAFAESQQDLGQAFSGEQLVVEFEFVNPGQESVVISRIETDCGCFNPRIFLSGQEQQLPLIVTAEQTGLIKVDFNTAGFSGIKQTGAIVFFENHDPIKLSAVISLKSWMQQNPQRIEFPSNDGSSEQRMKIEFTAPEPFKLTEVLAVSPPLKVEGIPSVSSNIRQSIELVIPPTEAAGVKTASFNLLSDRPNFRIVGMARYEIRPDVFLVPNGKILLGAVPNGVQSIAAVDVGANKGTIEIVSVTVDGIKSEPARISELVAGTRFRVNIAVTPTTAGAFNAFLELDLIHHFNGKKVPLSRKIQIFGVSTTTL
ncbi:MAG: DUF1573 domain-containing protein [Planctomycetota bacterium]|nr:DUF1573 domain-containing protein [Planctomycetota bacterium]